MYAGDSGGAGLYRCAKCDHPAPEGYTNKKCPKCGTKQFPITEWYVCEGCHTVFDQRVGPVSCPSGGCTSLYIIWITSHSLEKRNKCGKTKSARKPTDTEVEEAICTRSNQRIKQP